MTSIRQGEQKLGIVSSTFRRLTPRESTDVNSQLNRKHSRNSSSRVTVVPELQSHFGWRARIGTVGWSYLRMCPLRIRGNTTRASAAVGMRSGAFGRSQRRGSPNAHRGYSYFVQPRSVKDKQRPSERYKHVQQTGKGDSGHKRTSDPDDGPWLPGSPGPGSQQGHGLQRGRTARPWSGWSAAARRDDG